MAQNRFASVPNISIPRSRFKQPFNHSTSFKHGELIPIDCFEILPGDTYKIDMASLIWMSNPIRPIFGNITAHVDVFFVPMRLVWDKTQEFFGENKTSMGYSTAKYTIPSVKLNQSSYAHLAVAYNSLSHYLGKPISPAAGISAGNVVNVSCLKERGYYLIWNNFYRAQQVQAPILVNIGGNGAYAASVTNFIDTQNTKGMNSPCKCVNKEFDYFTAATLYPQYGPAVELPLGTYAPVIGAADLTSDVLQKSLPIKWKVRENATTFTPFGTGEARVLGVGNSGTYNGTFGAYPDSFGTADGTSMDADPILAGDAVYPSNLIADLSSATAATINSLRYAFAVQKYLERSNFGSRFFEMLQVHYGVTSPDATLQIPQRIGHADFAINISTVLSTAGAAADTSTELGMPGATSCTATKKYLSTHAFTEPGYLYVLLSTTHERSYTQGILREDTKAERYEIYSPEFANLGDQEILNREIFYGNDAYNNDVFGYQEHWAEYRYRPHRVSGLLDPQAPSALDFWVLTDNESARPSLNGLWLEEDRSFASRCLVSGAAGPDYIGDFYLPYVATREMPLFTIPGLIDHFGSY